MSISQATISRQIGVSRTAVSHVLNGREHMVSAETRVRILQAVAAAGYHRNALVRSIKANRTHVVGVVVPDAGVSFFGEIIRAVEQTAKAENLRCFLCQTHCDAAELKKQIGVLLEYRVDGIVIVPTNVDGNADTYRSLQQQHVPFVLIDVPAGKLRTSFVGSDNKRVGELATLHLAKLGHRRIAYIRGYDENPSTEERYLGYVSALKSKNLPVDSALVVGNGFTYETGVESVTNLHKRKVEYTALIASSDFAALGAIAELARLGKSVPQDVSVVGCGNLDVSGMVVPKLTTIHQHPDVLGKRAMTLLADHINGRTAKPQRLIIKPTLVARESTRVVY